MLKKVWGETHVAQHRGAALIVTMIVVLALSVVAVGVTTNNQMQSLMARSAQFRMESFNISYAEIDAQIDAINKRKISDGVPRWVEASISEGLGGRVSSAAADEGRVLDLLSTASTSFSDREIAQEYRANCVIYGQQIGVGKEVYQCFEMMLESKAALKNTSVESQQSQVYEYYTKS